MSAATALAASAACARERHGSMAGALSVTMPMGHEASEDAVARVLSVLSETAPAMRHLI